MQKCEPKKKYNSLAYAKVFITYKIKKINKILEEKLLRRLAELGFLEGVKLQVIRKSFLGKTFLVSINGFVVSIQKSIAEALEVEAV